MRLKDQCATAVYPYRMARLRQDWLRIAKSVSTKSSRAGMVVGSPWPDFHCLPVSSTSITILESQVLPQVITLTVYQLHKEQAGL